MITKLVLFVANWCVGITACVAVLTFCTVIFSWLLDRVIRHFGFYAQIFRWARHRRDFTGWLEEKKRSTRP